MEIMAKNTILSKKNKKQEKDNYLLFLSFCIAQKHS